MSCLGRLTLHSHILVWLCGHGNLLSNLQECHLKDLQDKLAKIDVHTPKEDDVPLEDRKSLFGMQISGSHALPSHLSSLSESASGSCDVMMPDESHTKVDVKVHACRSLSVSAPDSCDVMMADESQTKVDIKEVACQRQHTRVQDMLLQELKRLSSAGTSCLNCGVDSAALLHNSSPTLNPLSQQVVEWAHAHSCRCRFVAYPEQWNPHGSPDVNKLILQFKNSSDSVLGLHRDGVKDEGRTEGCGETDARHGQHAILLHINNNNDELDDLLNQRSRCDRKVARAEAKVQEQKRLKLSRVAKLTFTVSPDPPPPPRVLGSFHFYWYCLMINFKMMWLFGFCDIIQKLGKSKTCKEDCKNFHNSDQCFEIIFEGITTGVIPGKQKIQQLQEDTIPHTPTVTESLQLQRVSQNVPEALEVAPVTPIPDAVSESAASARVIISKCIASKISWQSSRNLKDLKI